MFDEIERLLAEDTEEGPGLGCISPEHNSRIESQVIMFKITRVYVFFIQFNHAIEP